MDRAQAGAVAQVRDHDALAGVGGCDLAQPAADIFVRKAVEAVALDAGFAELARQRKRLRDGRLRAMEGRVEAGDLFDVRRGGSNGVDGDQIVRLMKRRERAQAPE